MLKDLKEIVKGHFTKTKKIDFENQLLIAYNSCDELTRQIVRHHAKGGNSISAYFKLNVSPNTYYQRLRQFYIKFETLVIYQGKSKV